MTNHRHHQPRGRYVAEQDVTKLKAKAGEQAGFAKGDTGLLEVVGFSIANLVHVIS